MNLDFETYSEAGNSFDLQTGKWSTSNVDTDGKKKGLFLVGAYNYACHHSTEVTVACYSPDGGKTVHTWRPGDSPPVLLIDLVLQGGFITAWNSFFEWCIWNFVCVRRYGWPPLPIGQTRCSMSRSLAWSLPGSLDKASAVIYGTSEKDAVGKSIMLKLSQPRNATKNDKRLRFTRDGSEPWQQLDRYCAQDVRAETRTAFLLPPLSDSELKVWQQDQRINVQGIRIDLPLVEACLKIMKTSRTRYGLKLAQITGGVITAVSQATAILKWVNSRVGGRYLKSLETDTLQEYLDAGCLPPLVVEVLEIRRDVGGNAPAKLVAMKYQAAEDGRVRGALQYCGAQRTRRWAGRGIQTQNMPNGGPEVFQCNTCLNISNGSVCACGNRMSTLDWGIEAVEAIIPSLMTGDFDTVATLWKNPAKAVAGCLRSMLVPAPGHDFISSDYSAIEAVVMACIAGEQWIIDVFNTDGKLYERTGAKITGTPLEKIDKSHPARKLGKVASLASQFQGARGAWLKFGADKFLTNQEIDDGVKAWREAAPNIVAFWYAVESAAIQATRNPGGTYPVYRTDRTETGVIFKKIDRALYCILPGGDWLTYVDAAVKPRKKLSKDGWSIVRLCEVLEEGSQSKDGYNPVTQDLRQILGHSPHLFTRLQSNGYKMTSTIRKELTELFFDWSDTLTYWGVGTQNKWIEIETYGGKLAENCIQSTARFILSPALLRVEASGYPVVMHTHDEIVSEVPEGFGSVEEFENLMNTMPTWASDWPIKATGGWRGKRYRK